VRPIAGVQTAVAAFVGVAPRGAVDKPVQLNSWADYERTFGGLDPASPLSYAVYLFFLNGGSTAIVVRNRRAEDTTAEATFNGITLQASSPGKWGEGLKAKGEGLKAKVDNEHLLDPDINKFNLTITLGDEATETYPGLNLDEGSPLYLPTALAGSQLVRLDPESDSKKMTVPGAAKTHPFELPPAPVDDDGGAGGAGGEGTPPKADPIPLGNADKRTGMYALAKADIFNILCLPVDPDATHDTTIIDEAAEFCRDNRAMLIVDPPETWPDPKTPGALGFVTVKAKPAIGEASENAAVYYPNLLLRDPAGQKKTMKVGPCGAVAGVWASTDTARGVWKAPAGTAAGIGGIADLEVHVDDAGSGLLNPLGVNALRALPLIGPVVWGARTTRGADQLGDQWKYIPVRRTALFIEESLRRGTQWVVFEPNDEPLWSSIRMNIGAFMQNLFRQGAFQGATPAEAYLVKCDKDNNPQSQIDLGIVSILVGFAPLKPAEFVIINIQQQAGQA